MRVFFFVLLDASAVDAQEKKSCMFAQFRLCSAKHRAPGAMSPDYFVGQGMIIWRAAMHAMESNPAREDLFQKCVFTRAIALFSDCAVIRSHALHERRLGAMDIDGYGHALVAVEYFFRRLLTL